MQFFFQNCPVIFCKQWECFPDIGGDAMQYSKQGRQLLRQAMESARKRVKRTDGTTYDDFEIAIVYSKDDGNWVYMNEGEVTPE
jgi:hypothetical protein